MKEYQFIASTVEDEKKSTMLGTAALLLPAVILLVLFKGIFPDAISNQGVLWLVVVVPSLICFSMMMRFMQKHAMGVFILRVEGRHITVVHANRTVTDLGEVQRVSLSYSPDYKRADLLLVGSKDEAKIRLRSAAAWNGQSTAKDFREVDKALADIQAVLEQ